jgi:hypothetical protein
MSVDCKSQALNDILNIPFIPDLTNVVVSYLSTGKVWVELTTTHKTKLDKTIFYHDCDLRDCPLHNYLLFKEDNHEGVIPICDVWNCKPRDPYFAVITFYRHRKRDKWKNRCKIEIYRYLPRASDNEKIICEFEYTGPWINRHGKFFHRRRNIELKKWK